MIEHAGFLEDWETVPPFLLPAGGAPEARAGARSCSFCGVGDSGVQVSTCAALEATTLSIAGGEGFLETTWLGQPLRLPATLSGDGGIQVRSAVALTTPGGIVSGRLAIGEITQPVSLREERRDLIDSMAILHVFRPQRSAATVTETRIEAMGPTGGCVKFRLSMTRQRVAFPIHVAPSALDPDTGLRHSLRYEEAISRFADLLLAHRAPSGKTLIYACGQIDYFTVFAMQEVFRLLGVRNLTGNAEHCLNSGAVHNEILTGQEGPFLTIAQAFDTAESRFYLLNGWNGMISHPPAFAMIMKRPDADAFLFEVMETETAKALARKCGEDRVIFIRPASDPHIALAVANEVLNRYPHAVDTRFVERFAERESFEKYVALARSESYAPERVAARVAAEPKYVGRVLKAIRAIACKLSQPGFAPVNIPSVGLSQTTGVVAHCLWGDVFALVGKYGLAPGGQLLGGTLRLPGQINAESEVQGLSRKYFMGRVPVDAAAEAARRMGLPDDAYDPVVADAPRAALDYSDPNPDQDELIICFGTQFESNMMGRPRWIEKLKSSRTRLVVVDPVPDPFSLSEADLILPSPPHPATPKLYQNGEWRLSLSIPQKRAPKETRSDATILYDVMAEIARRVENDPAVAQAHPDLARHAGTGYLAQRFGNGLPRVEGEVSRPHLWSRVMNYMSGGSGPLYCRPDHADGTPITWEDLLRNGALLYGGVGKNRYVLDYDRDGHEPFADVYRRPRKFRFFTPTAEDLALPEGVLLNSGRSTLSDDPARIRFATSTFNSGKATPIVDMPDENPLYLSPALAERLNIRNGHSVRLFAANGASSITLPAVVSDRVKGDTVYVSFHKNRAEIEDGRYLNDVTSHVERCAYSSQTRVKASAVRLEPVPAQRDAGGKGARAPETMEDLPIWQGETTPLRITEIIRETQDVYTYRLQGDPLCLFRYLPGQFCSVILDIDGRRVVRAYSISSTPSRPFTLEITVKRVPGGLASNWMADHLKEGDWLRVSGPKGKFLLAPDAIPEKLLLLGAGSGVTPLMAMARWLCDIGAGVDVRFFNSVRSPGDIIFRKELELLTQRHRLFSPVIVTTTRAPGQEWMGPTGRISRHMLETAAPDLHERHVYLCGPRGFMESARALLAELQFDPAKLHLESFDGGRVAPPCAQSGDDAPTYSITFARSGKTASAPAGMSLLDLIESEDIDLDYGCRSGSCGDCKTRILSGEVVMSCEDGLDAADKAKGYVLGCVATPKSDCVLDL